MKDRAMDCNDLTEEQKAKAGECKVEVPDRITFHQHVESLSVSVSVGYVTRAKYPRETVLEMAKEADRRMYEAKRKYYEARE